MLNRNQAYTRYRIPSSKQQYFFFVMRDVNKLKQSQLQLFVFCDISFVSFHTQLILIKKYITEIFRTQGRVISSRRFDLFIVLDAEEGTLGGSRPMLPCVTLCPLIT